MFNIKKCPYCESNLLVESESKVKFWIENEEEAIEKPPKEKNSTTDKLKKHSKRKEKVMITNDE